MIFTHYNEPYGTIVFEVTDTERYIAKVDSPDYIKIRAKYSMVHLYGIVIKGSETARIGACTSTKDLAGKKHDTYVTPAELKRGWKRSIAM